MLPFIIAPILIASAVAQVNAREKAVYTCPTGYHYRESTKLCYPITPADQASNEAPSEAARELPSKRLNSDVVTVNIYNNTNGQMMKMPDIDVEGKISEGIKRRRSLDKQAVLGAVEKSLEGDWMEEEKEMPTQQLPESALADGELVLEN